MNQCMTTRRDRPGDPCSVGAVFGVARLSDWIGDGCEETPVARYRDRQFAAVLWLSISRPREQRLDVHAVEEFDGIGDLLISASTDWTPPPRESAAHFRSWDSGFSVSVRRADGERAIFVTGLDFGPVVGGGTGDLNPMFEAREAVGKPAIRRLEVGP